MIDTVLFDMGGTLEDIWYSEDTIKEVTQVLLEILKKHDLEPGCTGKDFWDRLSAGVAKYKKWSEGNELEKKPDEIWPDYYLADFDMDKQRLAAIAEDLAGIWEVTYYHRELRPDARKTLDELKGLGYRLGVISNTASVYSVFDVLEEYGIRDYFENITLSSVTGYRKPNPEIFRIALREMNVKPGQCAYIGDTLSRDVSGAKLMGFGKAIQICSFLSAQKDVGVSGGLKPDCVIKNLIEIPECLKSAGSRH